MINWQSYMKDKTVAIVGGDDDIDWKRVLQCDVVVRINDHFARQGRRCNVLYYSCADDLSYCDSAFSRAVDLGLRWAWLNMTHMLLCAPDQTYLRASAYCESAAIPYCQYFHGPAEIWDTFLCLDKVPDRFQWSRELSNKYSFHPLTGILALYHIIKSSAPRSIYVDGMSFYVNSDGEIPRETGRHDNLANIYCLTDMLMESIKDPSTPRITLSEKLMGLLQIDDLLRLNGLRPT